MQSLMGKAFHKRKCAHCQARSTLDILHFTGFYRLLKSLGMDPGLEFKVAMEEAELLRARIVFGDADQDRTMRRISESLTVQAGPSTC